MIVLGLDPGFASLGWAFLKLTPHGEEARSMGAVHTDKSSKKREVRASDDNVRRAQELADALSRLTENCDVVAMAAEAMSFPRQASVAAKMAMAWGVIAAFAFERQIPILQASPQDIKRRLTGKKTAAKDEVQTALIKRYALEEQIPARKGDWEHAFDALGAAVTCLDSGVILTARKLLQMQAEQVKSQLQAASEARHG